MWWKHKFIKHEKSKKQSTCSFSEAFWKMKIGRIRNEKFEKAGKQETLKIGITAVVQNVKRAGKN